MNPADFVAYALDPARTLEERYTIELLCEHGVRTYNARHQIHEYQTLDEAVALGRERKLNPAYQPRYTEAELVKTVWSIPTFKAWWHHGTDRPVRSLAPLRYFTALETVTLTFDAPTDVSPLADLPALRDLTIGRFGTLAFNTECMDYSPLARCRALRALNLGYGARWPDLRGLETLTDLETLVLSGNLLAMPPGAVFPNVRRGELYCLPLAARSVADLPQLPGCETLTLCGAERLDGVEKMAGLRSLTILGPFRSFTPLTALGELVTLVCGPNAIFTQETQPLDVSPLARLPKLAFFQIGPPHSQLDPPRDYSPLAEAPALHPTRRRKTTGTMSRISPTRTTTATKVKAVQR